jgi:hypothetical protein
MQGLFRNAKNSTVTAIQASFPLLLPRSGNTATNVPRQAITICRSQISGVRYGILMLVRGD